MKKLTLALLFSTVSMFGQYGRPVAMPEPSSLAEIGVAVGAVSFLAVRLRANRASNKK